MIAIIMAPQSLLSVSLGPGSWLDRTLSGLWDKAFIRAGCTASPTHCNSPYIEQSRNGDSARHIPINTLW